MLGAQGARQGDVVISGEIISEYYFFFDFFLERCKSLIRLSRGIEDLLFLVPSGEEGEVLLSSS